MERTRPRLVLHLIVFLTLGLASPTPCAADPQDGFHSGVNEGTQRGGEDGQRAGNHDGRSQGFSDTAARLKQAAQCQARDQAFRVGTEEGTKDGAARGAVEGQRQGAAEGSAEGNHRADRDALTSVQPRAKDDGIQEATQSDASPLGQRQGSTAGQQEAEQRAQSYDRLLGQEAYRRQRFAEPPKVNESWRQGRLQPPQATRGRPEAKLAWLTGGASALMTLLCCALAPPCSSDGRYCKPVGNSTQIQAYRNAYEQGFQQAYKRSWQCGYDQAYRESYRCGSREAEARDYQGVFREAFECARSKFYETAYQNSFESAREQAYQQAFQEHSQNQYAQDFPRYQREHYQRLKQEAYRAEYERIRLGAFEAAREARYALVYPSLSQREHNLGRLQEKEDFNLRPVRLLEWSSEPSDIQNVYLTTVTVRNFSNKTVPGKLVRLRVQSAGQAEWLTDDTLLLQPLPPLSCARVTGALRYVCQGTQALQCTLEASYLGTDGWRTLGSVPLTQVNK